MCIGSERCLTSAGTFAVTTAACLAQTLFTASQAAGAQPQGTANTVVLTSALATWPLWLQYALGAVVALASVLSTVFGILYFRARTRAANAETEAARAASDLAKVQLELQREQQSPPHSVSLQGAFDRAACPGRQLCYGLIQLRLSRSVQQAIEQLDTLRATLTREEGDPAPVAPLVAWAQGDLSSSCDGNLWGWASPGMDNGLLETKALETYVSLLAWFTSDDQASTAVADCCRWLTPVSGREIVRKEAARILLHALLNSHPKDLRLVDAYDAVIHRGLADEFAGAEQDIVLTALTGLATLPRIGSDRLRRLLESGFLVAARRWRTFGTNWCQAVHLSAQGNKLERSHARQLADMVSAHVRTQGLDILRVERDEEYAAVGNVLVSLHRSLGIPARNFRPRVRHVANEAVRVQIAFSSNRDDTQVFDGHLGNFAHRCPVGWKPGAWITVSSSGTAHPVTRDEWRKARLSVETSAGEQLELGGVLTRGPFVIESTHNQHGDDWGFRIKFCDLSTTALTELDGLASRFPVTR